MLRSLSLGLMLMLDWAVLPNEERRGVDGWARFLVALVAGHRHCRWCRRYQHCAVAVAVAAQAVICGTQVRRSLAQ